MNIALIGPAHPYRGGISTFTHYLAFELIKQGHNVKIYTFSYQYPSFLFPGKTQFREEEAPDLNIERCIHSLNPFNWIKVGRKIKKSQHDLIIVKYWLPLMGPALGTILRIIKKGKEIPIVGLLHNLVPHEKRFGDRIFTQYFTKAVDQFIAMSASVLRDAQEFPLNKPVAFSPHPLFNDFGNEVNPSEARQHLKIEKDTNYLLFFGLIRKYKGLDLLLKAMANDNLKDLNIRLIVAGEFYDDKAVYDEIIDEENISDRITIFNQFIPDSEVKYFFSAANLVVQPYKSATQSGVTQIAYHFNKPMIVTNVGGLKELCPHGKVGYVVEPNPEEIALAIIKYFKEKQENVMRQNVMEEKKKFSWDRMVKTIFQLLDLN